MYIKCKPFFLLFLLLSLSSFAQEYSEEFHNYKQEYPDASFVRLNNEVNLTLEVKNGKIEIEHCKSKKLSNLNIETDDFLNLVGKTKKVPSIQITLNYFTRKPTRQIFIDGENISAQADLIKKNVVYYNGNKKRIYNFRNSDRNSEYKKQHLAILENKYTDKLCTFKEGKQLVYLINQIRSQSKK